MNPHLEFEVVKVRTQGDANPDASLTDGTGCVFVKEIERQLQEGLLDMAVHSLKDLPTRMTPDLAVGAVLRREDPRDVLVNRWGYQLSDLPEGARIGTSSPRRQALLKNYCPQVVPYPSGETWKRGCARPAARNVTAPYSRRPVWPAWGSARK